MRQILPIFWLIILLSSLAFAQEKKVVLLAEGFYFDPLVFDPTESLNGAGVFNLWESNEDVTGVYIPVNLALHQSLIRWKIDSTQGFEFGLQAAAFTQFEISHVGDGTYLGGMVNVDYRATGFINYYKNRWSYRLRLFHISSHLADDYIFRNDITSITPNTLNYEQIDLTTSFDQGPLRFYGGIGYIFTPNSIRARFSSQFGFQYRQANRDENFIRLLFGLDVKIFEENNYRPNYRGGIGVEMGQPRKPHIALLFDIYNGHLPYSTLEFRQVTWFGISAIVLPKRLIKSVK